MIKLCCKICAEDVIKITNAIEAEREKAKRLVEALKDIEIHSSPPFTGNKWHAYVLEVVKEALAKWEKEK